MAETIKVGDQVLVNKKYRAVVRFIGPTAFKSGIWYGVELEREKGKHNGTVYGVTYFVAKPNHGTFVDRDSLSLYDPQQEAASIVTDLARKGLDRRRAEREAFQKASLVLDADEENKVLLRRQLLEATLLGATLNRERPDPADVEVWEREAEAMTVEASYDGPHISFPLTLDMVLGMQEAFKRGKKLHYRYAMMLLSAYRRYANELPTLVEVEVQPSTRLTVCGDTHGQLKDLLSIYTINGIPSPTNRYLMNGDFVDRGDYSCEIVFTLFAWVLLYPGEARTSRGAACLLNRGNHESHNQNMTQGFMSEVLEKYSGQVTSSLSMMAHAAAAASSAASVSTGGVVELGLRMYDCFLLAFDAMPLAHLLKSTPPAGVSAAAAEKKQVFVVHGGLMHSQGVRLAHIAAIRRKREIPYGYPAFEDKLYEDLMWSDPRPNRGTAPNTRGAGVYFGPDVTERFCAGNQVGLVVRSHECVQEGYQFMHEGRLITVFSASHYCGRDTNKGAFIIFEHDMSHTIQQYIAGTLLSTAPALNPPARAEPTSLAAATGIIAAGATRGSAAIAPVVVLAGPDMDEATAAAQAENVRRMIMERVIIHKPDLYVYWSKLCGANGDGRITKAQWSEGMRTVLNLELPWIMLAPSLVESDPDGKISYPRFLDRYTIAVRELDVGWMEGIIERASEKLFSACHTLEQAYSYFDVDSSGAIELLEFEKGLQKMDIGLSQAQLVDLMNAIDSDKDGRIQLSEFVSRFQVVFSRIKAAQSAASAKQTAATAADASLNPAAGAGADGNNLDDWTQHTLNKIGAALFAGGFGSNVAAVFTAIDSNADGSLSPEEWSRAIRSLKLDGPTLTEPQLKRLFDAIDLNGSGGINYFEFVQSFRVADSKLNLGYGPSSSSSTASSNPGTPMGMGAAASGAAGGAGATAAAADAAPSDDGSSSGSRSWQRSVIERVIATLFEYRLELVSAFKLFDVDGNGIITREEFRKGLQALTSLTGSPITDMQADELMRALDRDGSGTIDYSEFVDAFAVVDSSKPKVSNPSSGSTGSGGAAAGAGGSGPGMSRLASLKNMGGASRKL